MINANELRIGNLLIDPFYGTEVTVTIDVLKSISEGNDYKPVPLTEEILLKCGFVADASNESFDTFENGLKFTIIDKCGAWMIYLSGPFGMVVLKHIKHLHQLQNLYFALTGKELVYSV